MKNHTDCLQWAVDSLGLKQYTAEMVVESPWSIVTRLSTKAENFYVKQTPPLLFLEPSILLFLKQNLQLSVPVVLDSNNVLCCFLMKDAGQALRHYLKKDFQSDLLAQAVKVFTGMQRSTEYHVDSFLKLGVPDWRLDKLPNEYKKMINQTTILKAEGLTNQEIKSLHNTILEFSQQCEKLSRYKIPAALVQPDFNTNNILLNANTKKMTCIDLGEIVISHPILSLHNFMIQAMVHHGVKEGDFIYNELLECCCNPWLDIVSKDEFLEMYALIKKIWPIYCALGFYRLMMSVDAKALKIYCANKPRIEGYLRTYIDQK